MRDSRIWALTSDLEISAGALILLNAMREPDGTDSRALSVADAKASSKLSSLDERLGVATGVTG